MIKIAPSILSADFTRLGDEIKNVLACGADYIHFDVMDGVFVPNISFGLPVLNSVSALFNATLDVHLMIDRPLRYVERFCESGADIVNIHIEASTEAETAEALSLIKSAGKIPALTAKPQTPPEAFLPFIDMIGLALVMTVEPGFGGQSFMLDMLDKIRRVKAYLDKYNPQCELEVDGGINAETARLCKDAGACVLVAGNDIFKSNDRQAKIDLLRG